MSIKLLYLTYKYREGERETTQTSTMLVIVVTSGKLDEEWGGKERYSLFFFKHLFFKEKKRLYLIIF